jgi:hypothetical protein
MFPSTTNEAEALALAALTQTLTDERRAQRFLDLTGIETNSLRRRVADGDRGLFTALFDFLEAHEPDLIAVADAVGVTPGALAAARGMLEQ